MIDHQFTQEDIQTMIGKFNLIKKGKLGIPVGKFRWEFRELLHATDEEMLGILKVIDFDDNGYITLDELVDFFGPENTLGKGLAKAVATPSKGGHRFVVAQSLAREAAEGNGGLGTNGRRRSLSPGGEGANPPSGLTGKRAEKRASAMAEDDGKQKEREQKLLNSLAAQRQERHKEKILYEANKDKNNNRIVSSAAPNLAAIAAPPSPPPEKVEEDKSSKEQNAAPCAQIAAITFQKYREVEIKNRTLSSADVAHLCREILSGNSGTAIQELHLENIHLAPSDMIDFVEAICNAPGLKLLSIDRKKFDLARMLPDPNAPVSDRDPNNWEGCYVELPPGQVTPYKQIDLTSIGFDTGSSDDLISIFIGQILMDSRCQLEELRIGTRQLGETAAHHLGRSIVGNNTLQQLYVESKLPIIGLRNGEVYTLDWREKQINDRDLIILGYILRNDKVVRTINLRDNRITSFGLRSMAQIMKGADRTSRVDFLDVTLNKFGDEGFLSLTGVLGSMPKIATLMCKGCDITTAGVMAFAPHLAENRSIRRLHLENNQIDDIGVNLLLDALEENKYVKTIILRGNYKITKQKMKEAMEQSNGRMVFGEADHY